MSLIGYFRPHWAKEMPTIVGKASLVEYLQKAYAKDLTKVQTSNDFSYFLSPPTILVDHFHIFLFSGERDYA